jgi:hypothetical protein
MSSNINTNLIDATFPLAGQDNSSEGFHNNYTAIKNALNTAASEITDLQITAVLKNADNDLGGFKLSNAVMKNTLKESVSPATLVIDYESGSYQKFIATSNTATTTTITTPSNWPAVGVHASILVEVASTASTNINFVAPLTLRKEDSLTLPHSVTTGTTVWELWTTDQGSNVYLRKVGGPYL